MGRNLVGSYVIEDLANLVDFLWVQGRQEGVQLNFGVFKVETMFEEGRQKLGLGADLPDGNFDS